MTGKQMAAQFAVKKQPTRPLVIDAFVRINVNQLKEFENRITINRQNLTHSYNLNLNTTVIDRFTGFWGFGV